MKGKQAIDGPATDRVVQKTNKRDWGGGDGVMVMKPEDRGFGRAESPESGGAKREEEDEDGR